MKSLVAAFCVLAVVGSASSARAQMPVEGDGLASLSALIDEQRGEHSGEHHGEEASGPAMTLEEAEGLALAANPEIAVAARRVAIAEAHVPIAGALDDLMAMYRGWGVPLNQPWNYNQTQNMFSISQTFPGRGKRDLRTSVAESDVDVAKDNLEQVRLGDQRAGGCQVVLRYRLPRPVKQVVGLTACFLGRWGRARPASRGVAGIGRLGEGRRTAPGRYNQAEEDGCGRF